MNMSDPQPPKVYGTRHRSWWRDSSGKMRWKNFGEASKVSRMEAFKRYQTWLSDEYYKSTTVSDPSKSLTVSQLCGRYQAHADAYYRDRDGQPTREAVNIQHAIGHLLAKYPDRQACGIGLKELKVVRETMIKTLSRKVINQRVNKIRSMYRWAAEAELIGDGDWMKMSHLSHLARGRTPATESEGVKPAPVDHINAAVAVMHPTHAAMVRVQMLTAMRPGELCIMRGVDIQQDGDVWWYRPARHKNDWRGHTREIAIGPQAIEIIKPLLTPGFIWKPTRVAAKSEYIKPNPYLWAIYRACDRAKVDRWSPGQLRHNALTTIRREAGLEAAQVVGGHSKADTTQIYAERNRDKAAEVIARVG